MLSPREIDKIEEIGTLDGSPVRLIKTVGGFWVAAGKPKGKKQDEALAASSHPAIVKYNVEKQFQGRYTPNMAKAEGDPQPVVRDRSALLKREDLLIGFRMFTVTQGDKTDTVITLRGSEVASQSALAKSDSLEIQPLVTVTDVNSAKRMRGAALGLAKAFAEEAVALKKEFVQLAPGRVKAEALLKR